MSVFGVRAMGQMTVTIVGSTTICQGAMATFTADVSGEQLSDSYQYTWLLNGHPYGSVLTTPYLNISTLNNGDQLYCYAQDLTRNLFAYSNVLTVTISQPATFIADISVSSLIVCAGSTVTFTASANAPASFTWLAHPNAVPISGSTFTIAAATTAQLQQVSLTATNTGGTGTCVAGGTVNLTASSYSFTVLPLTFPAVTITQSITPVVEGSPVTFTAVPDQQNYNPGFQWQLNGIAVSGVTGATYTPTISSGSDVQSVSVTMTPTGSCPQNTAIATTPFQLVSSDWENQNYIRVQDILIAGNSNFIQIDQLPIGQKRERTAYLDGLGRPIQKLDKSGSLVAGTSTDLVQPVVYDPAGRNAQQYLPYITTDNPGHFKTSNVLPEQATFVTSKFGEPSGAPTYSQIIYDNSPANRIIQTLAPGASWGGSNVGPTFTYDFNVNTEMVHIWTLDYSATPIPVTTPSSVYLTGTLFKNTTTDELGNEVVVYIDLSGDTILKKVQLAVAGSLSAQHAGWACTYYVYDDMNQLRFIIPPTLVDYLDANGWSLTQQLVNDLCFVYTYDLKGRAVSKKQPGIGETDVVYDQRDRPVFMQDALGLQNNQWKTILYDALDRVTTTGMLQVNISTSALQISVTANTGQLTITTTGGAPDSLIVTGQQDGVSQYVAADSIVFESPFQSDAGGSFTAFIDPGLGANVADVVAIADNPIPSGSSLILLTQTFYDDYSQGSKTYTMADNSLFDPTTNLQALPLPSQIFPQTRGQLTVTKVKVITNSADLTQGNWLETDNFYDNQGRVIQTQNDNYLGGNDIVTSRFDYAGKLWGSCVKHMAGSPTQFTIVSRVAYDALGRLTDLAKNFNSTFFKDLASYTYDEYGKLVSKVLAPGYTGAGKTSMEALAYNYNIQGWMTGINQSYALDQNTYDQWNDFFGLYLGYDNRDNQFAAKQYDGSITGVIWKSQGDNSMRKYDFTYDNMGRLTGANFNQRFTPADNWSNSQVDLSELITYNDKNGNILNMQRKGLVPGMNGPVQVDNLVYTYGTTADPNVNQLSRVDETAPFSGNGQLSDFKDGTNAAGTNDYTYDANGNLTQDQNKGITAANGVQYNYLNKPVSVTIAGKTSITYIYDAAGTKLSKTVTNLAVTPNTSTTTTYDDEFAYQDNVLQYVLHEEGRLNIITPLSTPQQLLNAGTSGANNVLSGKQGVFEYFIKDQLSNVRLVLTEEAQTEFYIATMETSNASDPNLGTDEAKLFGQIDPSTGNPAPNNEVNLTRTPTSTSLWTGNTSQYVSHLTAALTGQTIGPNMLLKVSSGDIVNTGVNYFYYTNNPAGPTYNGSDAITALLGALLAPNISALAEGNSSLISSNLGSPGSNFSSLISANYGSNTSQAPKAFLAVLFFDEQFNLIPQDPNAPSVGTNLMQVSSPNSQVANMTFSQKAPKNGWVYIYLSNESNQDVYFDNLSVSQVHGAISEENHYYAFGEKIGGLCTTGFQKLPTKFRYQGDFSEEEENTNWNEFDLRNYDPQIGRWTGADPDDQFASPYVGMGNDPVNSVDQDGGTQLGVSEGGILGGIFGAIAGPVLYDVARHNGWNEFWSSVAGAAGSLAGSGIGYATGSTLFPADSYATNWANSLVAFYKGLFGDVSYGTVQTIQSETGSVTNSAATIPAIWGSVGSLIPSVNISLPNLAGWIDDFSYVWQTINVQWLVTQGLADKYIHDKEMKRTTDDNFIHDEGSVRAPGDDPDTRTNFELEGPPDPGYGYDRTALGQEDHGNFTVKIDQRAGSGNGTDGRTGKVNHGIFIRESRVKIVTEKRMATPIKRYRFLGIRLPITKRT
jgi:RHS repeat-associated protein